MVIMVNVVTSVVRMNIDERLWRDVKTMAVSRREPVQEFASKLLKIGLNLIDEKECPLENALDDAEEKFLSKGFRVLRGGAIIFRKDRTLHMELMKDNIHIHITLKGIWAVRDPDYIIVGGAWDKKYIDDYEIENEKEKEILSEALIIAQDTFSDILKDYAKLNIGKEIVRLRNEGR